MIADLQPLPAFKDNYIWAFNEPGSGQACVVDPGEPGPVLDYLQAHRLGLAAILITHHHPDHVGGLARLLEVGSPVVYGPVGSIPGIQHRVGDQDRFTLFGETFDVLAVPGHTLDHIAYVVRKPSDGSAPMLFCGDTLFAAGCGRIFEGDPDMMYQSLQKLASLGPATRVYCTHEYTLANLRFAATAEPGNLAVTRRMAEVEKLRAAEQPTLPSVLAEEFRTNPFLRCGEPALQASAQRHAGHSLTTPTQVFATLRQWKDHF
ncbi:MAG: Hydroxyacylglutathione hydrolase [Pseudomonadota bacterium]